MFKCDGDRLFVCLWCIGWCQYLSHYSTNWYDDQWKIKLNGCGDKCHGPVWGTVPAFAWSYTVKSGNNGRMIGWKLLKENIRNIFFFLLVFVCFCCTFLYFLQWFINSFHYQNLFRPLVFKFPVQIISRVLITSNLLYFLILYMYAVPFLAFCSGWINDISNIMGLDSECVMLLLLFCSFVVVFSCFVILLFFFCCCCTLFWHLILLNFVTFWSKKLTSAIFLYALLTSGPG